MTTIITTQEEFDKLLSGARRFDRLVSPDGKTVYAVTVGAVLLSARRAAECGEERLVVLGTPAGDGESAELVSAFKAEKFGVPVIARGLVQGHAMALVGVEDARLLEQLEKAESLRAQALKDFFK